MATSPMVCPAARSPHENPSKLVPFARSLGTSASTSTSWGEKKKRKREHVLIETVHESIGCTVHRTDVVAHGLRAHRGHHEFVACGPGWVARVGREKTVRDGHLEGEERVVVSNLRTVSAKDFLMPFIYTHLLAVELAFTEHDPGTIGVVREINRLRLD
jgi:hypothetical protein